MARKNKPREYTDLDREKAIQLYGLNGSISKVSRELNIPWSTVKEWISRPENCETVVKLREESKIQFAEKASDIIDKGLLLIEKRINTALDHEIALDNLIHEIFTTDKEEISQDEKKALVSKIRSLQLQKLGEISNTLGTLFDKRALARGEATANETVRIELSAEVSEYAK